MKINDLIEEWMNENHKLYIKENTLLRYRCSINNHIKQYFDGMDINEVSPRIIQKFIYELKENKSKRTGRKLTNSTINNIIALLKLFFHYCVDYEIIEKDPTTKIKNLHVGRYKTNKAFTKLEQRKIEAEPIKFCLYFYCKLLA